MSHQNECPKVVTNFSYYIKWELLLEHTVKFVFTIEICSISIQSCFNELLSFLYYLKNDIGVKKFNKCLM